jgi:hypothetical protein
MTPQDNSPEEIRTHIRRFRAFIDGEVQSQLQLTDDQQEQIRAILRDGFQEAKPIRESLIELQKRTLEKATAVLTDEQKSQWEEMQGQDFEVEQEADNPISQDEPGMGGGPGGRRAHMGGPGMWGGPGRGQRMGGPGMGGGPGRRGARMGGPGMWGGPGRREYGVMRRWKRWLNRRSQRKRPRRLRSNRARSAAMCR